MEKIKVLHIQGRLGLGGAETFLMNSYRNINREIYEFHFVVYDDFKDVDVYNDEIESLGGQIHITPNPNKNIFKYMKSLKKIIQDEKIKIVHNQVYFGGGLNLMVAKKSGAEIAINHSHATGSGSNPIRKGIEPFFRLLNSKYSDYNFACSTEAGNALFKDQPFVLINNGIDLEQYEGAIALDRALFNIQDDALILGAIGRLEDQKNYPYMISIMEELIISNKNVHLLIIGEGTYEQRLKDQIKESNLESNVTLLGARRDIPQFLQMTDIFLMTSFYEGLPIVSVEAQASGCFLVLSDKISSEVKLTDYVKFLPIDVEPKVWANEILSINIDDLEYARSEKMESYDMRTCAKQLQDVYDDLTHIQNQEKMVKR